MLAKSLCMFNPFSRLISRSRDYTYIILGMAIYAFGFTAFILPHEIVMGGAAGAATLIYYATGGFVPVAVAMYGLNLLLLAAGFKFLGKSFVVRTIFGSTVLALLIGAMEGYFTSHPPVIHDVTMSVAMGAILCGVGIGLYFTHNGTAGGTDIVAAVMARLGRASVGRTMMVVDMTLVALSFFLPFDGDLDARVQARVETIIYGWSCIFVYSYIADRWLNANQQTIQFIILSPQWETLSSRITHEMGRGVTLLDAEGYWTHQGRRIMLVWCRKPNVQQLFQIVAEVDPGAYVTFANVNGIYGNGFDMLKPRKPQPRKA